MRCPDCFEEILNNEDICPKCGYSFNCEISEVYHLIPGSVLHDRYVIGRVLGFGGFGVVYKGWDETLDRIVAVKEYFPTMYLNRDYGEKQVQVFDKKNRESFEKGRDEFLQEARNIAKFNTHPNIVHIYDFFEENGTAYFVMEYLDGHTLREYVSLAHKTGYVFTVKSGIHIAKEVLNALRSTHKEGIIHRDIKPNNIFILKDGTVKLFDFGAARFSDTNKELTRTVIITPGYAPPEQYQTKSKQGAYTDIYAVGAVLYEMLTGVRPDESINRKVVDELEIPSSINSKVPVELDNIILRAMAVRPEIRFTNVNEFYKLLDSHRNVRNAEKEIKRRNHRRNRIVLGLLLIVAAGGAYAGWRIYDSYREAVLDDCVLKLWVPEINNDAAYTENLYREMAEEFISINPQISIDYRIIPKDEYVRTVSKALIDGNGPDIFESSELRNILNTYKADLSCVYDDVNYNSEKYLFMDTYKTYFINTRRIPLLMDLPVLYENIMVDDLPESEDYKSFVAGESDYIGSVLDNDAVQSSMTGMYQVEQKLYIGKAGEFLYYFSINDKSDKARKTAAARLINYYLSDNSQEKLAIDEGLGLPMNKEVWDVYMSVNSDFAYLTDEIPDMYFQE